MVVERLVWTQLLLQQWQYAVIVRKNSESNWQQPAPCGSGQRRNGKRRRAQASFASSNVTTLARLWRLLPRAEKEDYERRARWESMVREATLARQRRVALARLADPNAGIPHAVWVF